VSRSVVVFSGAVGSPSIKRVQGSKKANSS
jgi:hypothetical protein